MAILLSMLAGCAALRGTDPGVAAADRILGTHTGGLAISVIIPSIGRDGSSIPPEKLRAAVQRIEAEMARVFGGYTTQTGTHGGWLDDRGVVEREDHAAIVTACGGKDADQTLTAVRNLATTLARELNQQCITVIVNDRMYLIPPG